jgi:uncharacterized protein YqgQ
VDDEAEGNQMGVKAYGIMIMLNKAEAARIKALEQVLQALRELLNWYDHDGSVGGSLEPFAKARVVLAQTGEQEQEQEQEQEPPIRPNDDPPEQVRAREEAERRHRHRHDAEKPEQFLDVLAEAKRVVRSGQGAGAGASDELFRKMSEWSDDEFFRALAAFEYEQHTRS